MATVRIPKVIAEALRLCTKPTEVRMGKKHVKVYVGNRMVGVISREFRKGEEDGENVIRAIRKADQA